MTHVTGLRLINWQRFRGEHVLALGRGTYAVTAQDADDDGRSNWLGKSALLAALRWALEGHKPRTVDALDELISHGEDNMGVEVELSDGTFISRLKKRGSAVDLGVDITTDDARGVVNLYKDPAQDEIWRVIGLTADDLMNTAYAEQKKLAALVDVKGTGLHDIVAGWLQLERLVAAGDESMTKLAAAAADLKTAQAELAKWEADPLMSEDPEQLCARISQLEELEADTLKRQQDNKKRIQEHDEWLKLKEQREQAEQAQAEVARLTAELPLPVSASAAVMQRAAETAAAHRDADRDYQQKRTLATGEFAGLCPVMGKSCPITAEINSDQAHNKRLLQVAHANVIAANTAKQVAANMLANEQTREREHARAAAGLEYAKTQAAKLAHRLEQPLPAEPDVVAIVEGIGVGLELSELRKKHDDRARAMRRVAELRGIVEQLTPRVRVARAAAAVLGPEGAQRRIAERAVQSIERTANADLAAAGIGLTLAVRWGRETQQPARQCPQCGTAFPPSARVKTCTGCLAPRGMAVKPELRFRLSNVSGAAEDLAGLALRCSAFKWLRARRGAQWGLAVLDEPFGSLDRTNKRALAAHVQSMLAGTFEQALLVAHDAALLDGCQHRIAITARGKWSEVKVAA